MAKTAKKHPVVRQEWIESERGWGQRPDGFTIHLTDEDRQKYCQKFMDDQDRYFKSSGESGIPECYSKPGGSDLIDVDSKTYRKLVAARKKRQYGIGWGE
jgi:hypothetical protein